MIAVDPRYPAVIRELWAAIKAEVVWLHGRWIIYRQLFGTSPERVAILNQAASTFANILQKVLLHDVQLSISKLGDSAGSGTRTNLTLAALLEQLESGGEMSVVAKLRPLIASFDTSCAKIRNRRNKWIAHFDRETMLAAKATPLTGPSREEIELALVALREVMNCVEFHYTGSQTAYEHFVMNQDGEHLISTLMQGLRYKQLVREKAIPHDDLRKNFAQGVSSDS